jgi:hypothetical protein
MHVLQLENVQPSEEEQHRSGVNYDDEDGWDTIVVKVLNKIGIKVK